MDMPENMQPRPRSLDRGAEMHAACLVAVRGGVEDRVRGTVREDEIHVREGGERVFGGRGGGGRG